VFCTDVDDDVDVDADVNVNANAGGDGVDVTSDLDKILLHVLHLLPVDVERKAPDDVEKKISVAMADWNSGNCFFIPLASSGRVALLMMFQ